jgi:hypothetical protein
MARPHHRKKHREHLRQFRQKEGTRSSSSKTKASWIMATIGAVFGLGVSYIATQGELLWMLIAVIICTVAGYFMGLRIDKGN